MKVFRGLVFFLFCSAAFFVIAAEKPKTQIGNSSLENLTGVSPRIGLDSTVKFEGENSLKIFPELNLISLFC